MHPLVHQCGLIEPQVSYRGDVSEVESDPPRHRNTFSQRILKRGLSIFKLLSYFLQPSILSKSCVVREYLGLPNQALFIIQSDWKLKQQSKQADKKEQIIWDTNQRLPLSEWLIFALDGVIW